MKNIILFLIQIILKTKRRLIKYDKYRNDYIEYIQTLIKRGLKIGKNVTIESDVFIDGIYPYLISIGDNSSIAINVRIFAHDDSPVRFTGGYARLGKVEIKENCFIGDSCIINPGVTIGPNVIVAAGSVVNKSIPPNSCVAGVPARFYAKFDDTIKRIVELKEKSSVFSYNDLHNPNLSEETKRKVIKAVESGSCFVKGKPNEQDMYIVWNTDL